MRSHHARSARRPRARRFTALLVALSTMVGLSVLQSVPAHADPPIVVGPIAAKYLDIMYNRPDFKIGLPLANQQATFNGGLTQEFENGTISYHPNLGQAHEIHGDIRLRWMRLGKEEWGYPTTDELPTPPPRDWGRFNYFAHFNGADSTEERAIYWTNPSDKYGYGAVDVQGDILKFWGSTGWEQGPSFFPMSPETNRPFGAPGKQQMFSGEGPIISTPTDGAAVQLPTINFTKEYRSDGVQGHTWLQISPYGDWEFTGSLNNYAGRGKNVFVTCLIRSSAGQVFQFSAEGRIGEGGTASIPAPGRPRMAGRSPEIATAWPSISRGALPKTCVLGADEDPKPKVEDTIKSILSFLGPIKTVIEIGKTVLG